MMGLLWHRRPYVIHVCNCVILCCLMRLQSKPLVLVLKLVLVLVPVLVMLVVLNSSCFTTNHHFDLWNGYLTCSLQTIRDEMRVIATQIKTCWVFCSQLLLLLACGWGNLLHYVACKLFAFFYRNWSNFIGL